MNNIKNYSLISSSLFNTCLICGATKDQILEMYPSRENGAYFLDKFSNFLRDNHKILLKDYCKKYLKIEWPLCPVSKEEVGYSVNGKGIKLSRFKKGKISKASCPNFALACKKMSKDRMGENNPMFGLKAWNKGKDKRHPAIKLAAQKRVGRKVSEDTKKRQSESAKKRLIHGHTGLKHSRKAKEKMRLATAKRYQDGMFKRESGIHIKMREFLKTLELKEHFAEEHQVKYFSLDFAFIDSKIGIECQGTYFHIDPRIYPNGPKSEVQKRNFGRDKQKKKFLLERGWKIIECWETEINDGSFKGLIIEKLKESNLLNN